MKLVSGSNCSVVVGQCTTYLGDTICFEMRGALIVLEGCDRAGKSVQSRKLLEKIRSTGAKAELLVFPDRTTELGKLLDRYLKKEVDLEAKEAHLLFAANRHAAVEPMKAKLCSGTHLIVDRYAYSGIAYTVAKNPKKLSLQWARLADVGILKPDCVIFLDLPPEKAAIRGGYGSERFEIQEFQKQVYDAMTKLISQEKDLWEVIDASKPIEEVFEKLWQTVESVMKIAAEQQLSYIEPIYT